MSAPGVVRIAVAAERCVGAGQCVLVDPETFDQDEVDGTVVLRRTDVPAEALARVREAVALCPSGTLSLEPGDSGPD
ncbi:MAG TPA: ferredoxin [Pilimelia sp.]|nr:ferredoxin [Pilimelia sp.]